MKVTLARLDDAFHFRATNEAGHTVDIDDATAREDGLGQGVGPMQMLLMAVGGCSGIDLVSILQKSRQPVASLDIEVEGDKPAGVAPALFTDIHLHYVLTGEGLDPAKVRRAVDLSLGKYCSVAKTLEKTARITGSFSVNGTRYEP